VERSIVERDGARSDIDALLSQLAPYDVKIRPPDLRGRMIERRVLNEHIVEAADVVVLTAGAGYGKTTLLAQSVRSHLPWAWLTLHAEDNDPATIVAYLLRALQTAWTFPAAQLGELSDPGASEISILLPRLSRLVQSITGPGVLVLDEVDTVEDARCLRILETVLESAPQGLHVLLSGRSVPALGLESLRTRRRILELHEDDLVFTYSESLDLVASAQLEVDPVAVRHIHRAAEGWAAGIYLMALAAQGADAPPARSAVLVASYVREQVLSGLSPRTIEFLLRTSILDLQDGPSCDALLGRADSAVILAHLSESHLFVTPVDGTHGWYRYHGLLSDVLRAELLRRHPNEVPLLHARASQHFATRSEGEAAVRHALASEDMDRAADLIWGFVPFMLGMGKGDTLSSWLRGLGDRDYDTHPVFAVVRALASSLSGDGRQARLWLSIAQRHRPEVVLPDGNPLAFYLKTIEALICDSGVSEMVRTAQEALAMEVGGTVFRCIPLHVEGCGVALLGDLDAAIPRLDQGIDVGAGYPAAVVSGFAQKAAIAILNDDWLSARRFVMRARELYEHFRLENVPTQAPFPAVAAIVAAFDGDLAAAEFYSARARMLISRMVDMAPWLAAETRLILGQVEHRLGRQPAAAQLAREARTALERLPDAVSLETSLRAFEEAIGPGGTPSEALTTAEIRLVSFLPTHLTFGQIADELCLSVNTVKSQAKAVYRKLDVMSRREAVDRATTLGLLTR
jgi:LuxR family transcriptional regulator, maltose regulon positive regulatory protein